MRMGNGCLNLRDSTASLPGFCGDAAQLRPTHGRHGGDDVAGMVIHLTFAGDACESQIEVNDAFSSGYAVHSEVCSSASRCIARLPAMPVRAAVRSTLCSALGRQCAARSAHRAMQHLVASQA